MNKPTLDVRLIMYSKDREGTVFDMTQPNESEKVKKLIEIAKTKGLDLKNVDEQTWW